MRRSSAARWSGLVAGYVGVFVGYVALLIALFDPEAAVIVARVVIFVSAIAGTTFLAVWLGRLVTRQPRTELVER